MDSGFSVLKALIKLALVGVFASAVIKKRRYWPKYINGGAIDTHFEAKEIGTTESLPGVMDGVQFRIYCMKEEDYVMKLMATYGALRQIEEGKTQRSVTRRNGQRENVSFHYTEPFYNHFKYRHQVDDHNNLRHSPPILLEESISTKDWKLRVFTFVLALIEVNARLAIAYFVKRPPMSQLDFRRTLAKELFSFSSTMNRDERSKSKQGSMLMTSKCGVETAPPSAGSWSGTKWELLASRYPQHVCHTLGCQKRIRTYCKIMVGN
ncbi:Transposase IS4 [Fragilaria crotonensis]|nr:Transposase IS4 [Fragilaria crotonensis]